MRVVTGTKIPISELMVDVFAGKDLDEFLAKHRSQYPQLTGKFLAKEVQNFIEEVNKNAAMKPTWTERTAKWNDVREYLFAEILLDGCRPRPTRNAFRYSVSELFEVFFHVSADHTEFVITQKHLTRWGQTVAAFIDAVGWRGGEVAPWDWPKVSPKLRLLQYQERGTGWIYHLLSPGCLLEHSDVPAPALLFAPTPEVAFLTGLPDLAGQRRMLKESRKVLAGKPPLMRRPLVINSNWTAWDVPADADNPFAAEYDALMNQ